MSGKGGGNNVHGGTHLQWRNQPGFLSLNPWQQKCHASRSNFSALNSHFLWCFTSTDLGSDVYRHVLIGSTGIWGFVRASWGNLSPTLPLKKTALQPPHNKAWEALYYSLGFIKIPLGLAPAAHCLSFNAQQQHPFRIKRWPQVPPSWPKLHEEAGVDKKRRNRELLQEACRPFPCFYPQGCYNVTSDTKAGQITSISMSSFSNIYLVILCCKLTKTWLS